MQVAQVISRSQVCKAGVRGDRGIDEGLERYLSLEVTGGMTIRELYLLLHFFIHSI